MAPAATNSGQNRIERKSETRKGKGNGYNAHCERRTEPNPKGGGFKKENGNGRKIGLRSQTMRMDTGRSQVITGMRKVRIAAIRHQMLEKAIVKDIKVDQIITGLMLGTGK